MTKLSTILDQIDAGSMLLPEFQRGYVWNRDQVRGLMRSLYLGYPVGALLVWETEGDVQPVRGAVATGSGQRQLLLDGQQRVTTLYGLIRGAAPAFFEGDDAAFTGLRFNVETEAFQFHAPIKMKDDPRWVDVTALFRDGMGGVAQSLAEHPETAPRLYTEYLPRLQDLLNIANREFHVEQITGADKTVDVVVDIFNRVNSGGTKLSKGDLALARICSEWADARPTMRRNLDRWAATGFKFPADWLLRNTNAVATGRAPFSALENVSASDFQHALTETLHHVDHLLFLLGSRLGVDHDRVLFGRNAIPVLSRLLHNRGGRFADGSEADKALYWYVHAALRGRFAAASETALAKDLETVDAGGIDAVIASLSRSRKGNMRIDAQDFEGVGRGARSYPLLYLLTRVRDGLDLVTGRPLGQDSGTVEVHEIFPKAELVRAGYSRAEVNAIANFAFVGPASASRLSGADPAGYLAELPETARRSQWIPEDPSLWRIDRYREFLDARRELLGSAATGLMDDLITGRMPWNRELQAVEVRDEDTVTVSDPRAAQLASLVEELSELGYAVPARDAEIADPDTGRELAVAELFWERGLQPGMGKPVVLELDPDDADLPRLAELGFDVFTTVDALRGYVQRLGEQVSGDTAENTDPVVDETPADGAFEKALYDVIERCRIELGYNAQNMRELIYQYGPADAVRRILNSRTVTDGYVRLWEAGRLDLAVETVVVDPRFRALFSPEERAIAESRLHRSTGGGSAAVPVTTTGDDPEQAQLARRLAGHLRLVRSAAEEQEFVDLPLAEDLHRRLGEALNRWSDYDAEQRRVLGAAVGYLVRTDDDEDDLRSPVGFDDDAEVVEEALRRISR
ncbi:GmrSD restriction endonuclease domain-containing protein [Pseudonocardia phyllosphaerae]|uniref:GmrSD restriction endonuclease domain-containing protein n=1 Tax=Pseudonocardia phyllosphaerae TaxID=3390502 RepID=UPI00397AE531